MSSSHLTATAFGGATRSVRAPGYLRSTPFDAGLLRVVPEFHESQSKRDTPIVPDVVDGNARFRQARNACVVFIGGRTVGLKRFSGHSAGTMDPGRSQGSRRRCRYEYG